MATKKKSKSKAKSKARSKSRAKPKSKAKSKAKKSKAKSKSKAKKKAFGGYAISFAGRTETAEQIFGKKPVAPSEMTKKIWAFVKSKKLANR